MSRIISLYPNWANVGGAQNIVTRLAVTLNERRNERPIVLCDAPQRVVVPYADAGIQFLPLSMKTVRALKTDDVILSHHRKATSSIILLNRLLRKRLRIIHVAHNIFTDKRRLTLFPSEIIAVSNGVKENLVNYFHQPEEKITVIFNGIKDTAGDYTSPRQADGTVKILLAGRVCPVKRQVECVQQLSGKLPAHVHIYFAGNGKDFSMLKQICSASRQFHALGNIDMARHLPEYDYVLLFSEKEGLGLTLVEGCMASRPLLTNNLTSVCDVNHDGINGFVFRTWDELADGLHGLPRPDSPRYEELSRAARSVYEDNFTEEKMIDAYDHYILGHRPSR